MITQSLIKECVLACQESYKTKTIEVLGIELYVPRPGLVVVRGSDELLDWFTNFRFTTWPVWGLGIVHAGLYKEVRDAWDELESYLTDGVVITGHSKGAGQAILMAAMALRKGVEPGAVVAFAPPRVGGRFLRFHLRSIPTLVFRNGKDPVPLIPLAITGFVHPVTPTQLGFGFGIPSWQDHLIPEYVEALHL